MLVSSSSSSSSQKSVLGKRSRREWINLTRLWQDNIHVKKCQGTALIRWPHRRGCGLVASVVSVREQLEFSLCRPLLYCCTIRRPRARTLTLGAIYNSVDEHLNDTVTIRLDDEEALFFWCEVTLREVPLPLPFDLPAETLNLICAFADKLSVNGHVLECIDCKGRLSCDYYHRLRAKCHAGRIEVEATEMQVIRLKKKTHQLLPPMRVTISVASN
jgi:hypothetical protein